MLAACGIPRPKVAAIIAMSAIYGMIAPPISLPTMIMGSGVDMPFTGFDMPLLIATMPLAIGVNLGLARRYLKTHRHGGRAARAGRKPRRPSTGCGCSCP